MCTEVIQNKNRHIFHFRHQIAFAYFRRFLKAFPDLIEKIRHNNEFHFMSPVNELSGKVRSAVTGILRNLFNDVATTSDADIRTMVDAQFASAKNTILA